MSDSVIVAIIIAVPGTIAAIVSLLAWTQSRKNNAKIATLEINVDGKMERLLELHGKAERAAGVDEGRQQGVEERQSRVAEGERVEDRAIEHARALHAEVAQTSLIADTVVDTQERVIKIEKEVTGEAGAAAEMAAQADKEQGR